MPARPRKSEELLKATQTLAQTSTDPQLLEVARMAAMTHYGVEIGLAFVSRGADTVRGRQLIKEYDALSMWLTHKESA